MDGGRIHSLFLRVPNYEYAGSSLDGREGNEQTSILGVLKCGMSTQGANSLTHENEKQGGREREQDCVR